jgi:hypothetical protein
LKYLLLFKVFNKSRQLHSSKIKKIFVCYPVIVYKTPQINKLKNIIMKTSSKIILVLLGLIMTITVNAQDYKHPYGFVDKDGKITYSIGTHLVWITPAWALLDNNKVTIAHVDLNGNLIDQ